MKSPGKKHQWLKQVCTNITFPSFYINVLGRIYFLPKIYEDTAKHHLWSSLCSWSQANKASLYWTLLVGIILAQPHLKDDLVVSSTFNMHKVHDPFCQSLGSNVETLTMFRECSRQQHEQEKMWLVWQRSIKSEYWCH